MTIGDAVATCAWLLFIYALFVRLLGVVLKK